MQKFKFTISGNDYEVDVKKMEDNLAKIEVNGTVYNIELQKEKIVQKTPVLKRSAIKYPEGSHMIKKVEEALFKVKAPLPGNVMEIYVKKGDEVKKGDKLLMYEAMKMENNILAEKDGTISEIKVNIGDAILQDDDLIYLAING